MCSSTAAVRIGLALSILAAIPASAQVAPSPVAVTSGGASLGIPAYAGIAVAAGAVSVIGHAAYVSITLHRELTSREAMTAIFIPFIGPLVLGLSKGDENLKGIELQSALQKPMQAIQLLSPIEKSTTNTRTMKIRRIPGG